MGKLIPPLNLFEQSVRAGILATEQQVMDLDSMIDPRKLGRAWEKIWWPMATEEGMSSTEANTMAVNATYKFMDYCGYDISGPLFETIGIEVPSEIQLPNAVLATEIDLIKMSLKGRGEIVLIDFTRRGMKKIEVANDPAILATVYAYSHLRKPITYICIDLDQRLDGVAIQAGFYSLERMPEIYSFLKHISNGISKRVNYIASWMCQDCRKC